MDYLDDFVCSLQSDEFENEEEEWNFFEEGYKENRPSRAERRKNEWKFANRRKEILKDSVTKPLHYYSKNMPESYAIDKRQVRREQCQIDDFENQMKELFD